MQSRNSGQQRRTTDVGNVTDAPATAESSPPFSALGQPRWEDSLETLQFSAALSLTVVSLVLFQRYSHRSKEDQKAHMPDTQARSKEMFEHDEERYEIKSEEIRGGTSSGDEDNK